MSVQMKVTKGLYVLSITLLALKSSAQPGVSGFMKMSSVLGKIKQLNITGYNYNLEAKFPDGSVQAITGKVLKDPVKKMLLTSNSEELYLFDSRWLYKANHRSKIISVTDVTKERRSSYIDSLWSSNDLSEIFIDSLLLPNSRLRSFEEHGDTIHVIADIKNEMSYLKTLDLIFDSKHNIPVSLTLYYKYNAGVDEKGQPRIIYEILTCKGYNTKPAKVRSGEYFSVKNGKVSLHKYKDYKLETLL